MKGSVSLPFSALFADTVREHGLIWAAQYYAKRGMQCWEFLFWMRSIGVGVSVNY